MRRRIDVPVWEAAAEPEQVPGLGTAAVKALRRFMDTMEPSCAAIEPLGRGGGEPRRRRSPSCSRRCSPRAATSRRSRPSARSRRRDGSRTSSSSSRSAASSTPGAPSGEGTLDVFLQQIALVADADTRSDEEGLVTLMTLHNAKGLEYPIVFIAGCEDGVFPHSRAIDEGGLEEERRLFYVGITRAMRQLYLTYARRRAVFGAQTLRHAQPLPRRDPGRPAGGARRAPSDRASRPRAAAGAARRRRSAHAARGSASWAGSASTRQTDRRAARARAPAVRLSSASARMSCTPRSARAS